MSTRDIILNLKLKGTEGAQLLRAKLQALKPAAMEAAGGMTAGEKSSEHMGAAMARLEARVGGLSSMMRGLGVAAGAAFVGLNVGSKLGQGLHDVIDSAIDLESRFNSVRKTTGLTGDGMRDLQAKLSALSTSFGGFSLKELTDVAAIGGRLGVAGPKVADFSRDISMLRVALEDIPAEEIATSVARILNVFHLGIDKTKNFGSALNALDDASTAAGRDILDVTQRLSGSAAALGLPVTKVLALATAMKDAGLESEVAGSSMSQILAGMATNTAKFAQVAGVSFQRFAIAVRRDPLEALTLFLKGLKKFDGVTQLNVLEQLGLDGIRVKGALLQLGQVMDRLPGYVKTANTEFRSLGSLLKENETSGGATKAQLERLSSVFDVISMNVGVHALPVIKKLTNSLVTLGLDLDVFLTGHKSQIATFADGIGDAAKTLGLLGTEFGTVTALAREFGLQTGEQFLEIFKRIGPMLVDNATVLGGNLMSSLVGAMAADDTQYRALVDSMMEYLSASVNTTARMAGKAWSVQWKIGLAEAKYQAKVLLNGGIAALDRKAERDLAVEIAKINKEGGVVGRAAEMAPAAAALARAQKAIAARAQLGILPLPGIVNQPRPGFIGPAAPGIHGLLEGLPRGHQDAIDALNKKLNDAGTKQDAAAEARKAALLPKGAENPFLGKSKAELDRERRKLFKDQEANRAERGFLAARRAPLPRSFGPMAFLPVARMDAAEDQQRLAQRSKDLAAAEQARLEGARKKPAVARAVPRPDPRQQQVPQGIPGGGGEPTELPRNFAPRQQAPPANAGAPDGLITVADQAVRAVGMGQATNGKLTHAVAVMAEKLAFLERNQAAMNSVLNQAVARVSERRPTNLNFGGG